MNITLTRHYSQNLRRMTPTDGTLKNCPDCRQIKCICPKQIGMTTERERNIDCVGSKSILDEDLAVFLSWGEKIDRETGAFGEASASISYFKEKILTIEDKAYERGRAEVIEELARFKQSNSESITFISCNNKL